MAEPIDALVPGVDYPARLAQLRSWFPTDDDCRDYLEWVRWPYGFICPHCGASGSKGSDDLYRCRGCRRRVSVTAGTIFQDTRTPLSVWFEIIWLMVVPKNGVSAQDLYRIMPVGSYQTVWTMLTKLRTAMTSMDKAKLSGVVEVDEWYHGGVAKGGSCLTGKNLVVAAVEHAANGRGLGRVRFRVILQRTAWELRKAIYTTVEPGSRIITDGLNAYPSALAGYTHEPRNESAPDAAPAHVLLPGVHRVFSLADRWLLGTHQGGVKPGHLHEYLDEFAFRFNRRHSRHRGLLFYRLIEHAITAPPVTYKDLVRQSTPKPVPPHPPTAPTWPGTLETTPSNRPWRQAKK